MFSKTVTRFAYVNRDHQINMITCIHLITSLLKKTITTNTTTTTKKINLKPELQFEALEERLRNILFTKKDESINNSNLIDVIIPIKHPVHSVFFSIDHRDTVAKCKYENCSLMSNWKSPFIECLQS